MKRRDFLKLSGMAVLSSATGCVTAVVPRRPNFVVVLADDMSPFELGCYGQRKIRTPNIDRLAAGGMLFTDCASMSPVCAPSRCGLLTGLHMGHAQVRDNWERGKFEPGAPEGQWPLTPGTDTLARTLKAAGYRTGCFGKWGLGGPDTEGRPLRQGFDRFYGYNCQRHAHQYWPDHLWNDDTRVPVDNPVFSAHQTFPRSADPADPASYAHYRGKTYAPDLIIAEAEQFVTERAGMPFFLYYATPLPHVPLAPPEADVDAYEGAFPEKPYRGNAGYLPQRRPRAAYAAMVSRVDADVGRLTAALKAAGEYDNTIFIFTADNGTTFNGGSDRAFFKAAGALRECKCSIYNGGLQVPFVVGWPGHIPAGSENRSPIWLADLYPTFCALAGAEPPKGLDGVSIAGLWQGAPAPARAPFYWEFQNRQALRRDNLKWVRTLPSGKTELYDLAADPGERHDLAGQHPDLVVDGQRLMDAAHVPNAQFPLPGERRGACVER